MAPDYGFYTSQFGGTMSEGAFASSLVRAVTAVKDLIGMNEVDEENMRAYMMAVCAACEVFASNPEASFSIGSFRYSGSGKSDKAAAAEAARPYLVGTGLLFQGLL